MGFSNQKRLLWAQEAEIKVLKRSIEICEKLFVEREQTNDQNKWYNDHIDDFHDKKAILDERIAGLREQLQQVRLDVKHRQDERQQVSDKIEADFDAETIGIGETKEKLQKEFEALDTERERLVVELRRSQWATRLRLEDLQVEERRCLEDLYQIRRQAHANQNALEEHRAEHRALEVRASQLRTSMAWSSPYGEDGADSNCHSECDESGSEPECEDEDLAKDLEGRLTALAAASYKRGSESFVDTACASDQHRNHTDNQQLGDFQGERCRSVVRNMHQHSGDGITAREVPASAGLHDLWATTVSALTGSVHSSSHSWSFGQAVGVGQKESVSQPHEQQQEHHEKQFFTMEKQPDQQQESNQEYHEKQEQKHQDPHQAGGIKLAVSEASTESITSPWRRQKKSQFGCEESDPEGAVGRSSIRDKETIKGEGGREEEADQPVTPWRRHTLSVCSTSCLRPDVACEQSVARRPAVTAMHAQITRSRASTSSLLTEAATEAATSMANSLWNGAASAFEAVSSTLPLRIDEESPVREEDPVSPHCMARREAISKIRRRRHTLSGYNCQPTFTSVDEVHAEAISKDDLKSDESFASSDPR
eukprot:gnl/MRDRNA2_/MRDRNA2_74847_c0_seq1.p1 gnl/MRDRNA2_/MRDRNA2_74847_c0~~gnl/MRDRNA2_/MRDRNA2_74847_c0_seq1.p1  ORF type:complete len:595 (-),score=122.02 gnl/MRDRNA2_/MRDRNA2_74847_c0_seq1:293-2077(-)